MTLSVRPMLAEEFDEARAAAVAAFGADEGIGRLLDQLRDSWAWIDGLSFVADLDGEIVGHVLYTQAIVDGPTQLVDVLVLSPLSVRPDMHGKRIGSQLVTETLERLSGRPEPVVFLEGSPNYYPRFGFEPGASLGFTKPSVRIPDPAFMAYKLPRYDPSIIGALVYPDAFWRTDSVGLR